MRAMKDSGVDWIGELPKEWNVQRLKDVYFYSNAGEVIDKSYWNLGSELLYTCQKAPMSSNYNNFPNSKRTASRDLLLTRNATPYIFIPEHNSIYSNVVQRIKIKQGFDVRFIKYSLECGAQALSVYGDTIPSYNMQVWSSMYIPQLVYTTQKHIADYLDHKCDLIDSTIEKQKAVIEKLKLYKQTVITEAVTKGLDKNAKMKPSGIEWIGDIPEGWETTKVKFVTSKIGSGKTPHGGSEIYIEEGIIFLRSQNIYNEGIRIDDVVYISDEIDDEMSNTRVYENDILLNITGGSIGRACIYKNASQPANVNQHVCIIRPIEKLINVKFLHYVIISDVGFNSINIYQSGANREGLNFVQIENMIFPNPSLVEQHAVSSFLDKKCTEIDKAINSKQKVIDKLADYKKSLIYECVTGKREV